MTFYVVINKLLFVVIKRPPFLTEFYTMAEVGKNLFTTPMLTYSHQINNILCMCLNPLGKELLLYQNWQKNTLLLHVNQSV